MLHLLKFERVRSMAAPLGKFLAAAIAEIESGAPREMMVVAVPLHPSRTRRRGYNQSILLAESALRILRKQYPEWRLTAAHEMLRRNRVTEILFPLTAAARRKMLTGAFSCTKPAAIAGKAVLLIDDIMTTGTTARECSKTLLEAGAASVHVATLARAQKQNVASWSEAGAA
jgi:ComF family protein